MNGLCRLLGALLALASCTRPPPPAAHLHYVLEPSWQSASGAWFYPHEQFDSDATGLAVVATGPHPPLTTDGEVYDPGALAAAHQTIQLPAVVRVTNLENGRQILVRVNDRGPDDPGRLLALTPRAGLLLAMPDGAVVKIRVQAEGAPSRQLSEALRDASVDRPPVAAPRGAVQQTDLAPPPGARAAATVRVAAGAAPGGPAPDAAPLPPVPLRLPEAILQLPVTGGQLYLRASVFARRDYAGRQAAQLAGMPTEVEQTRTGRTETFQVRAGPFASVRDADAALDQARRRGVTDSRIVVE